MSAALIPGQMSVEEFLTRPDREDGLQEELIEGAIVVSPNAKKGHSEVVTGIIELLQPLKQEGFVIHGEVACRLSPHSLPNTDACVFGRERWDAVSPDEFVAEAPALAIEVVSPGNRNPKLLTKVELYLAHGSEQVWLVYPKTRSVKVMTPDGGIREAREGERLDFRGLTFEVSEIFAR